jgi:hypothetical protein
MDSDFMDLSESSFDLTLLTATCEFGTAIGRLNIGIKGLDTTAVNQNNSASYPYQNQLHISYYHIMSSSATTIPTGSCVLVTGASGFLASHVIWQFLNRGFRVRGTVRDLQQSQWLLEGRFKTYAENGSLELVTVPDLSIDGAFDEAIKGVAAVLHIAYITKIVPDPNEVITPTVVGIRSIMKSAVREPSVKEIMFTSSALAASPLKQDVDNGIVDRDSWNDTVLEAAW